jgi:hypothetical protein
VKAVKVKNSSTEAKNSVKLKNSSTEVKNIKEKNSSTEANGNSLPFTQS